MNKIVMSMVIFSGLSGASYAMQAPTSWLEAAQRGAAVVAPDEIVQPYDAVKDLNSQLILVKSARRILAQNLDNPKKRYDDVVRATMIAELQRLDNSIDALEEQLDKLTSK